MGKTLHTNTFELLKMTSQKQVYKNVISEVERL